MKSQYTIAAIALFVIFSLLSFIQIFIDILPTMQEYKCTISVDSDIEFTEETALKVSQKALQLAGKDTSMMIVIERRNKDKEKYLKRELSDKNRGYILWGHKEAETVFYEYRVQMHKTGKEIYCIVEPAK